MKFSQSPPAIDWMAQFSADDRVVARNLLDAMLLVSHPAFVEGLRSLVIERAKCHSGKIGLYAEREIRKHKGIPNRLFKERRLKGSFRAYGSGPKPIQPSRTYNPEVGSEGLTAWIITELCRQHRSKFVSHPGPDEIRNQQICAFFLVTDFIGSGQRATTYLSAAWRVASVKSWHSGALFRSEVIAYSGTELGVSKVQAHSFTDKVNLVSPCPTLFSELDGEELKTATALCMKYDPVAADPVLSLGYGGTGALVAFAHGCPNNAPRILHCGSPTWTPLFPKRVTAGSRQHFGKRRTPELDAANLRKMKQQSLAESPSLSRMTDRGRAMILVLSALRRGPRGDEAIAGRTGLTTIEVRSLMYLGSHFGWINGTRHVTDGGIDQLNHARIKPKEYGPLLPEPKEYYYPKQLRAPA
jgi:hypothetical protein